MLNDFVAGALATGEITVLSDGTPWRPLIDVSDMARAIEWAIGREPATGGAVLSVNAGSDAWNYQVRDLARGGGGGGAGNAGVDQSRGAARHSGPTASISRCSASWPRSISRSARSPTASAACGTVWPTCGLPTRDFRNSSLIRLKTLDRLIAEGLLSPSLRWRRDPSKGLAA